MKITRSQLSKIIQEEISLLLNEAEGTAMDPEVIRVQSYLEHIDDRNEFLQVMGTLFRKLLSYADSNVTKGDFRQGILDIFGKDDAQMVFTVLDRADLGDDEKTEEPQDKEDRDDESLAAKDRKASDRENRGDEYAQTLADRRREQAGAEK